MQVETTIRAGESARVRFALSNLGENLTEGRFRLSGGTDSLEWDSATGTLRFVTGERSSTGETETPLIYIEPSEQFHVYLDHLEAASDRRYSLEWIPESGPSRTAYWQIRIGDEDLPNVQIVNQATARSSPFHAVPLYHEIYVREFDGGLNDLRIMASVPVRVEIWDTANGRLVAVDAQGNGSFADEGDLLLNDENQNLYPDFAAAEGNVAIPFDLLVFPRENGAPEVVTLRLERLTPSGWIPHLTNRIHP